MEFFHRAKMVRMKSHHNKYLLADDDEENVKQHGNGASASAKWTVESIEGKSNVIRLKNNKTWKYLSAVDEPHLLGWTGKRVIQASPRLKTDASVEWEPIKEGPFVKLRARRGTFLRANGSIPPWRNSVTHDVPSRSTTSHSQDWVLWVVDILEIDHTAEVATEQEKKAANDKVVEELPRMSGVSSVSGGGRSGSPVGSFRSARTPSPEPQEVDSLSRTSSTSSNSETPNSSYSATPATPQPTEEVSSPYIRKLRNNSSKTSKLSNSFNNLESVIADADKLLDGRKPKKNNIPKEEEEEDGPTAHEVRKAKQTLTEAKSLDFESILSSGKLNRVENAITILLAHESAGGRSRTGNNTKLVNLREQLRALKSDREKAGEEMEECEGFAGRKAEMKAELQKEVGRARDLQRKDVELIDKAEELRKRREELMRELERVEGEIREAEEEQLRNEVEIEEVCGEIGRRSDGVKEMEREEETWGRRKAAAERRLRQVEDDWGVFKVSLQMFEG